MKPCADPARALVYERVGKHLIEERPTAPGTCGICGATDVPVWKATQSASTGTCMAQLALTAKRDGVPDGMPLTVASPIERKGYSLSDDRCWIALDASGVTVAAKVRPIAPLPANAQVVRPAEAGRFEDRVLAMMHDPKPPMVAMRFAKKANSKMAVNHGGAVFTVFDRTALVAYDVERVGELVAIVQRFGRRVVDEAARVRSLIAKGDPGARETLARLRDRAPEIVAELRNVPSGREPEYGLAVAIAVTDR